jgi:hypothetical protein
MDGDAASGVPGGGVLSAFAEAIVAGADSLAQARSAVVAALGEAAMVDAAAVVAGFNGITRIADATGIPLEPAKAEETEAWRGALGIDGFAARKS